MVSKAQYFPKSSGAVCLRRRGKSGVLISMIAALSLNPDGDA